MLENRRAMEVLDQPICETPELAELFHHASPLAQRLGWYIAREYEGQVAMMKKANGPKAQRLAGCYHECGHMIEGVCLGDIPAGMVIDQANNARADRVMFLRTKEGGVNVMHKTWTWRQEMLVTAAGPAAKTKYRKLARQFSLGLDGAQGDIGKFEFLCKLLLDRLNLEHWQRFFRESSPAEVKLFFSLLDKQVAALLGSGDIEEFHREADRTPKIAAELKFLGRMAVPENANSPLWRKFVAEAGRMLDIDWIWRSVEKLAILLHERSELHAGEIISAVLDEGQAALDRGGKMAYAESVLSSARAVVDLSAEGVELRATGALLQPASEDRDLVCQEATQ